MQIAEHGYLSLTVLLDSMRNSDKTLPLSRGMHAYSPSTIPMARRPLSKLTRQKPLMRHSHASRIIVAGMLIEIAQQNLGRASLATTTNYVTTESKRRMKAMDKVWGR